MKRLDQHQGYIFWLSSREKPIPIYNNGTIHTFRSKEVTGYGWKCFIWFKVPQPPQEVFSSYPRAIYVVVAPPSMTLSNIDATFPLTKNNVIQTWLGFDEIAEDRCKHHPGIPRITLEKENKRSGCAFCRFTKLEKEICKSGSSPSELLYITEQKLEYLKKLDQLIRPLVTAHN